MAPGELESKFWNALSSDRTLMVGLEQERGHFRPMTAHVENDRTPIWFFTSKDNELVKNLGEGSHAIATYASKGHDVYASVSGLLHMDNDPTTVDRLWNRHVAAWYPGGKGDPTLALLRLDAAEAQIWLGDTGLLAGVKLLFGKEPKKELAGRETHVSLS